MASRLGGAELAHYPALFGTCRASPGTTILSQDNVVLEQYCPLKRVGP